MPARSDLKERLSRYREIQITVTGRKSGREITIPVWFVFEEGKLYLVPVQGSETQWFKNVVKNPSIKIEARDAAGAFRVRVIRESARVNEVVEKFRAKYGVGDVKKYYSGFDVAVEMDVG